MAAGIAVLAALVIGAMAWMWRDLDHRIEVGNEIERRTGAKVGPGNRILPPAQYVPEPTK